MVRAPGREDLARRDELGRALGEVVIKQLTGSDTVTARKLYTEYFEFRPTFKLVLAANHKPVIRGTDHAIWRRICLVPFKVTIPAAEQDPQLAQKLRTELPGILAWAVRGALEWQRQGLNAPAAVLAATETYRGEMDTLGDFLEERCVVETEASVSAKAIYTAYSGVGDRERREADGAERLRDAAVRTRLRAWPRRRAGYQADPMAGHPAGHGPAARPGGCDVTTRLRGTFVSFPNSRSWESSRKRLQVASSRHLLVPLVVVDHGAAAGQS